MTHVSLIYIIADIYSEVKANGALILGTVVFHQEDCSIGISSRGLCIMKLTSLLKCVISMKQDYQLSSKHAKYGLVGTAAL